jgi:hypothetical protein
MRLRGKSCAIVGLVEIDGRNQSERNPPRGISFGRNITDTLNLPDYRWASFLHPAAT